MEEIAKYFIESPQTAKAGRQRNLCHGHIGFVDQLLGEQHTPRLRDRNRRRSKMLSKQPPQMPLADSQPLSQRVDMPMPEGMDTFSKLPSCWFR